jgi:hypothetical protein
MQAQCTTTAQTNWDKLDFFYNSGGSAPYQSTVTDAIERTQKFILGPNFVTVTMSAAIADGENNSHTGDVSALYAGDDVQFTPTAASQTITLTFNTVVENLSFTLYDIDRSQRINVDAFDNSSFALPVNVTTYTGTILSVSQTIILNTNTAVTANTTTLTNNLNTGSATFTIAGPVKSVRLTIPTLGSDAPFWLSDLNACVTGSFPNNYQQITNNFRPFTGPLNNQPSYTIVTPDSDSVYYVDPGTGAARFLFLDSDREYVNSFGLDAVNRILYYISENSSPSSTNRQLKKIDLNTMTRSVVLADIQTSLGITTFSLGIESAGAAFYDGALYLGIEGGRSGSGSSTAGRESIIWRIDFTGTPPVPSNAYQVYASGNVYVDGTNTSVHDWGDFIFKNGVLINYNTARNGTPATYTQSKYHHYNLITGQETVYTNPFSYQYSGQASMDWDGNLYYVRDSIGQYDGAGTINSLTNKYKITIVDGPYLWPGGAGDASEPYRPRCDFGDAPATYDPIPRSPAVHERSENIRLGATWGSEWDKTSSALANVDTDEDAMSFVSIYNPLYGSYATQASVFNNSGAPVTLCAWLDMNGNGTFEATEGMTPMTIPSSASAQTVWLYIQGATSPLTNGSYTYLRIRITSAAMTRNHATGYFTNGEVEDFRVPVNSFPLAVQLTEFDAKMNNAHAVDLKWTVYENNTVAAYTIERSADKLNWEIIHSSDARNGASNETYSSADANPMAGTTYYRLRIMGKDGSARMSEIRRVENKIDRFTMSLVPNPASANASVVINSVDQRMQGNLEILNGSGARVYKTDVTIKPGTNRIEIPVDRFAAGSYMVRITVNKTVTTQTLIVNK